MTLERAHRHDQAPPRAAEPALVDELRRDEPGKRTRVELEALRALVVQLDALALRRAAADAQVPGRRTLVEATRTAHDRDPELQYDGMRTRGLRELLRVAEAQGGPALGRATLDAADPEVARAADRGARRGGASAPGGRAMWRAAERYAATLYRRAMDAGEVDPDHPAVEAALRRCGSGQPLAPEVRRAMEAQLDVALDRVRIHTDEVAAEAARAIHAEAFTVGEDIFFAAGAYAPDSRTGQRLLAHELTHVVQAWQGRTGHDARVSRPGDPLEREADAAADRVATAREAPAAPPLAPAAAAHLGLPAAPAPRAPASQPLLRKAAAPRGKQPLLRGGAGRSPNRAANPIRAASNDFSRRAGAAGDRAADQLKHGVEHTAASPPGKRAHDHARRAHHDAQAHAQHARQLEHQHLARGAAAAHHAPAAAAPAAGAVPAGPDPHSPIQLKPISDWSKFLPAPLPDQDDRERKRIEALVKRKIEGERGEAQRAFEQLRTAHLQQARDLRALRPRLQGQVSAAQQAALAHVGAAESSQAGAVHGHVAAVQGQVRAHAGAMKGQVTGAHAAAVAKINAAYQTADQQLTDQKTKALGDVDIAESLAVLTMQLDYLIVQGKFTAVGSSKAADAITVGEEESGKLGGEYHGDKLEAAQKAARDTADSFATQMPEQAAASYAQLAQTQPDAEKGLRDFATTTRDNVNKTYDAAKLAIDQIHTQSVQAADAAKAGALAQIDAACSATVASIGAQGAAQAAAIHQQGRAARAGIVHGGAAARASVGQACDQAATGIEGGIAGLISGAKQLEAPDPEATRAQVAEGAASLARGASGAAKGLAGSATKAGDGLTAQATGAAAGMAHIAQAAKAAATQLGAGAKQQMSAVAAGASQGLTQVVAAHKTVTDKTMTAAATGFTDQVTALNTGYTDAASQRATQFADNVTQCATTLDQTVPARGGAGGGVGSGKKDDGGGGGKDGGGPSDEIGAIQAAAKKAADAVKPWWQKALAIVVSIVVAVVVVLVVTALIATTGPVGVILVGALAGALASVAGQMASNLVLGNGLMDGVTWKTVAMGAVSGAIGAGLTEAIGAGATALAGEGTAVARGAATTVTALGEDGASTLAGYTIKTTIGVGTDFVSDQATNLIFDHKLNISVEKLVMSLATNAGSSHPKFEAFQNHVQAGIKNHTPFSVKVPKLQISLGHPKPPGGDVHAPTAGDTGGVHVTDGGHGAPPAATTAPAGKTPPKLTGDGGPPPPPKLNVDGGGAPTRPPGDQGNTRPPVTGDGGRTPAKQPGEDPPAHPANDNTPSADPKRPGEPDPKQPTEDPTATGPAGKKPTEDPTTTGPAGKKPTEDPTTTGPDGKKPTEDPTTTAGPDGKKPVEDPKQPVQDPKQPAGEPGRAAPPGHDAPVSHDAPTGHDSTGDDAAPAEAVAAAHDAELGELGYPAGTRAKGDELAGHIEQGDVPGKDTVRDTTANQDGVRQLEHLRDDPTLSPEQRAQLRRDLAARLRAEPEPTGKLPRDLADAQAQLKPAGPAAGHDAPTAHPGHDDGSHEITAAEVPGSSFTGRVPGGRAHPRKMIQEAGKSFRKLAREQGLKLDKVSGADDTYRVTTPEGETFTVQLRSEPLPGNEVANTIINPAADLHTIRLSDRADPAHVERALAHELAEIQEVRIRQRDGRPTDPKDVTDALADGATPPVELSPHDRGRLAELEVLRQQRDAAIASGDRAKVADGNRELQALIDHLGLRDGTPGADARRQLIEDHGGVSDDTRALLDELRRPKDGQSPEQLGLNPGNGKLVLGKGKAERVVDLEHIEALVDEVFALNDPDLMAAAQKLAAKATKRPGSRDPRFDDSEPLYHVREALLVQFRNNKRFDDPDPAAAMKDLVQAATDRLKLIDRVADVDWTADVKDIAAAHPERADFMRALDGLATPAEIDALWATVIEGVRYQKMLNDSSRKHDPNPHYEELAHKMADLLAVRSGEMPALWSGGYDISVVAQNRGFRTLEATQAGRLFDQLKLFKDFSTLGPLWNGISTKFVASFAGDTHVFVRTMDKDSVLFRDELATIVTLDGITSIKWHVMSGDDLGNLVEVDAAGNPSPGFTFDGFREAAAVMGDDAFRAPALPGEPRTPAEVRQRMLDEQRQLPGYVASLHDFVDDQAAKLGLDPATYRAELDRMKRSAELDLRNNPARGVSLADLYAQIRTDLGRDLRVLAAGGTP